VAERLANDWSIELISGKSSVESTEQAKIPGPIRRSLLALSRWFLVDRFELWSWLSFRRWEPSVDAAVLIGVPLSPLGRAARKLVRDSIPYVLDLGDLSVVGVCDPRVHGFARARTLRLERRLITEAAAVIVTTKSQAAAIASVAPELSVLVRPNGFEPVTTSARRYQTSRSLRLVHLGLLYQIRVPVVPFLTALASSGRWDTVTLLQLGGAKDSALSGLPDTVEVKTLPRQSMPEAYKIAAECDAALVVGNQHGIGIPSKAIQYLAWPLPRVAVVDSLDDELAQFVSNLNGWATVRWDDADPAESVAWLLAQNWSSDDLVGPEVHSWESVADEIAGFIAATLEADAGDSSSHRGSS
jgi:hypothetical protein